MKNWPFISLAGLLASGALALSAGADPVIGSGDVSVKLNPQKGFALEQVAVGGETFQGSNRFPTFILFNERGEERKVAADSDFFTVSTRREGGRFIASYTAPEFSADVSYAAAEGGIAIRVVPTSEKAWKIRAIADPAFLSVAADQPGARESAFLLRPWMGGQLIRFGAEAEKKTHSAPQSWEYCASFFAIANGSRGLIVRAPQFGAVWNAGTGNVSGRYSLSGGVSADFRPRRDNPGPYKFWDLPLCEPALEIQLIPVGDTNSDGAFNWVDIGVLYRERFIPRNRDLDPLLKGSIIGKVDISLPIEQPLRYDELMEQIRSMAFAPQVWWLVGAHTPPGKRFEIPPHGPPHASHDGEGGYDYFRFKADAAAVGARIGLHEMFQDTSELNAGEWGRVPIRLQEFGEPMGTWGFVMDRPEKEWAIAKALQPEVGSGRFYEDLGRHLDTWQVKPGDTWHWDVFTSEGGRSDFDPRHATTHGRDFRERIDVLRAIKERFQIHLTSEGLQEGVAEYCDFSWIFKGVPAEPTFAAEESVPLIPVLFQGRTYYACAYRSPAFGLLMGGYAPFEAGKLDRDVILQCYFGQNVFWDKICDLTVNNMVRTDRGWRVEYTQGGSLDVDLAGTDQEMSFTLTLDGKTYTADTPMPSPYGFTASRVDGAYRLDPRKISNPAE